jgi:hypothetical protein
MSARCAAALESSSVSVTNKDSEKDSAPHGEQFTSNRKTPDDLVQETIVASTPALPLSLPFTSKVEDDASMDFRSLDDESSSLSALDSSQHTLLPMPSDEELRPSIQTLFARVDISTTSVNDFISLLSKHMGVNVKSKKAFIKEQLIEATAAGTETIKPLSLPKTKASTTLGAISLDVETPTRFDPYAAPQRKPKSLDSHYFDDSLSNLSFNQAFNDTAEVALPSDNDIRASMRSLVAQINIDVVTWRAFFKLLSSQMGANLKPKKAFIKETLAELVQKYGEREV